MGKLILKIEEYPDIFKKIIAHCKEYGFIFQSSEIYDGLSAVYDYGQNGVELKNNIKQYWWDAMTRLNENIVGVDAAIFMHPRTWEASGHVSAFNDPLIDNKDSKKRYRADLLIEDQLEKIEDKIEKEVEKATKRFGDSFDEKLFRETNPRVVENQKKYNDLKKRFISALEEENLTELRQIIVDNNIVCPISGTANWTEARQFNLMFNTQLGSVSEEANTIYLRPETAQGIFVNYLNVQKTGRMKIPFGIAQIGKAFRNEIVARQFILRMREFEQMEIEYFVHPVEADKQLQLWIEDRYNWYISLGIKKKNLRIRPHQNDELAHYARACSDIEYNFPFGWSELEGIANRTDFDLVEHARISGQDLKYFDAQSKKYYFPYIIERLVFLSAGTCHTFPHKLLNCFGLVSQIKPYSSCPATILLIAGILLVMNRSLNLWNS